MTKLEFLVQFILPLVLAVIGYLAGSRKNSAESKKLEIEAGIENIELTERRINSYKKQLVEMQEEIEGLRGQISELKELIEGLTTNQCTGNECEIKKDYDKIIAKRKARQNARNNVNKSTK